jgi:hypothetical protein
MTPLVCAAVAMLAQEVSLQTVLARAAEYVSEFERQLSGIVAEEEYVQEVMPGPFDSRRSLRAGRPLTEPVRRALKSDLLLVKPPGAEDWLQFRDVFEVDGAPVRDRTDRLARLFIEAPASVNAQIKAVLEENARFNVGSINRTVNIPVFPLRYLETKNQRRFKFKRTGDRVPAAMRGEAAPPAQFRASTEVWVIEYSETQPETMVRTTAGLDLPSRGRFWVDPATGRVLMSELRMENRALRGMIDVSYQSEPLLGLLVPVEMREQYENRRDRSRIRAIATYGRFRQFQVMVDERFAPITPIRK